MDISWTISGEAEIQFLIPMRYLDRFKIEKIVPEGYETSITNGYIRYLFKVDNTSETFIHFFLNPQKTGTIDGEWRVNKQNFQLRHFIYP